MCELLGLSFKVPVTATISLQGLQSGASNNRDGWGFAAILGGKITKYELGAGRMDEVPVPEKYATEEATTFISHIRNASNKQLMGKQNSHPFRRNFMGGELLFAHNGTIRSFPDDLCGTDEYTDGLAGGTDSEKAMRLLMAALRSRDKTMADFGSVHDILVRINERQDEGKKENKFNVLMSFGDLLFCYADRFRSANKKGLWMTSRQPQFPSVVLRDKDFEIDLKTEKAPNEEGFIIATEKLTKSGDEWAPLGEGELVVLEKGVERYRAGPEEIQ